MRKLLTAIIITITVSIAASCRKQMNFSSDPASDIIVSTDTISFDTVFTCIGSSTRTMMIYNNTNDNLKINSIRLAGGASSPYSVNIDGKAGYSFSDKEIYANDSLFVFVKVTIDPTNENNPFFVEDKLIFNTNGNEKVVSLTAYGQNANYIIGDKPIYGTRYSIVADSLENVHWTADKPYVIYGAAIINSYGTLTIDAGARIHFHNNSGLWAWSEGQLIVNGTADNPVVFQGDRLESFYDDQPGQWDRIWLMEAREGYGHTISHAIIKNGFIGIQAQRFIKDNMAPLYIDNTIIENHTGIGIYANCYHIGVSNTVVANCGNYGVALTGGGQYLANHCTVANYWKNSTRKTPTLFLSNLYTNPQDGITYVYPFSLEMNNSIMCGSLENEFNTEFYHESSDTTYRFANCLLKIKRAHDDTSLFHRCLFNMEPRFIDYEKLDLHLDSLSPAIGIGDPAHSTGLLQYDFDGVFRGDTPDAGAYQFVNR
ncbi:MAG: hypothetical protein ACI358_04095 [Candidatus Limimorpha sp.]